MSDIENPQAYPCLDSSGYGLSMRDPGMTLRDYFAGQVAPTALAWSIDECDDDHHIMAAKLAYQFADAMLAQRTKGDAA